LEPEKKSHKEIGKSKKRRVARKVQQCCQKKKARKKADKGT